MKEYFYLTELEKERSNLIKALQLVQVHESYVADEALVAISKYFEIPVVEVEGVISFYSQFKRTKPGKYQIQVCDGTACHIKGSSLILDWISTELNLKDGETDKDAFFTLETVACLGCCSLAPVLSINRKVYGKLDRKATIKILREYKKNG